jgi:hypothetical protein
VFLPAANSLGADGWDIARALDTIMAAAAAAPPPPPPPATPEAAAAAVAAAFGRKPGRRSGGGGGGGGTAAATAAAATAALLAPPPAETNMAAARAVKEVCGRAPGRGPALCHHLRPGPPPAPCLCLLTHTAPTPTPPPFPPTHQRFHAVGGYNYFRLHPKGRGVIAVRPGGIPPFTFVDEYIGQLHSGGFLGGRRAPARLAGLNHCADNCGAQEDRRRARPAAPHLTLRSPGLPPRAAPLTSARPRPRLALV